MIRIDYRQIEYKDGVFYYDLQPLTGIGILVEDSFVVRRDLFENGQLKGTYSSPHLDLNSEYPWVDYCALEGEREEDEEPFLFQGQRFSGVACEIDGHFCTRECLIENGIIMIDCEYFFNGEMQSYSDYSGEIVQQLGWNKNGSFSYANIYLGQTSKLESKFAENGLLRSLTAKGGYFKAIDKHLSGIKYLPPVCTMAFPSEVKLYDDLFLAGDDITDQVLEALVNCKGFDKTKSISLFYTALSSEAIARMAKSVSLKDITVQDRRDEIVRAVQLLNSSCSDCQFVLNGELLEA